MPLDVQGRVLPFWKPPINIFEEPDCHGCCSALNVCQAMLKNCIRVSRLMHRTVDHFFIIALTLLEFSFLPISSESIGSFHPSLSYEQDFDS